MRLAGGASERATVKRAVVLATKNEDKCRELQKLMRGTGIRVGSLAQFGRIASVREDGQTYEANAEKKARLYSVRTRSLVIADDSGLSVRALRGEPGVYSARYAGAGCTYADNNRKLLASLRDVAWPKRDATFVSVVSIYDAGRKVATVRGECRGRIGFIEKGTNGFGYDPVFHPAGSRKTYAEMTAAEKNRISHRGRALRRAVAVLKRYFKDAPVLS